LFAGDTNRPITMRSVLMLADYEKFVINIL